MEKEGQSSLKSNEMKQNNDQNWVRFTEFWMELPKVLLIPIS